MRGMPQSGARSYPARTPDRAQSRDQRRGRPARRTPSPPGVWSAQSGRVDQAFGIPDDATSSTVSRVVPGSGDDRSLLGEQGIEQGRRRRSGGRRSPPSILRGRCALAAARLISAVASSCRRRNLDLRRDRGSRCPLRDPPPGLRELLAARPPRTRTFLRADRRRPRARAPSGRARRRAPPGPGRARCARCETPVR
jgi:hypothetical protein